MGRSDYRSQRSSQDRTNRVVLRERVYSELKPAKRPQVDLQCFIRVPSERKTTLQGREPRDGGARLEARIVPPLIIPLRCAKSCSQFKVARVAEHLLKQNTTPGALALQEPQKHLGMRC